jgi:hypothetical protein
MIIALCLLAVLAAVAAALALFAPDSGSPNGEPAPPTPATAPSPFTPSPSPTAGTGPRDGQLEFTVTDSRCGESRYGIIFAGIDEDLCIVKVTARNVGNSARFFINNEQFLVDGDGGRYQASQLDVGQVLWITPGSSAERTLVFKVPAGTEADHLELQDSDGDGGVTVPIHG